MKRALLFVGIVGSVGLLVLLGSRLSRAGIERAAAVPGAETLAEELLDASPPEGRRQAEPSSWVPAKNEEPLVLRGLELRVNVKDPRGRPVGDVPVTVKVVPEDGKTFFRYDVSDEAGSIRFTDLPPGEAAITGDALDRRVPRDELVVALETDAEVAVVVLGLLRYAGRFEPPPGPGLTVVLEESLGPDELDLRWDVRRTQLSSDGGFDFRGLAPGRYRLSLQRRDAELVGELVFVHDVELARSREGEVLGLPERLFLSGRVEASAELGELSLYLAREPEHVWRFASDARDFRFDDLLSGHYEVSVWSHEKEKAVRGRRTMYSGVLDLASSVDDLVIRVDDPVTVWVGVEAPEARPGSAGAFVLEDANGHCLEEQEFLYALVNGHAASPTGYGDIGYKPRLDGSHLELVGVRPGDWILHASLEGMQPVDLTFRAEEGMRLPVRFLRARGQTVRAGWSGRYEVDVRAAGEPWSRLLWDCGWYRSHGDTPGIRSATLAPGVYSLRVRSANSVETIFDSLRVVDDVEPLVLPGELAAGHALRGRIVTADGIDLCAGAIHLSGLDASGTWVPMPWKTTQIHGIADPTFEVRGLGPGRYRISFDPSGEVPIGEVAIGDADLEREFTVDI